MTLDTLTWKELFLTRSADCRWIAGKISEILGNEDDVVIELCFNLLEGSRFVRFLRRISIRAVTDRFLYYS
jgi:hypothetical protein